MSMQSDLVLLGHRVRHARRHAGLTLAEVAARVGRTSAWLSQLENGKVEPRLGQLGELAEALGTSTAVLLEDRPPDRRAELEMAFDRLQAETRYQQLDLPHLKVSARLPDDVLEHLVALGSALPEKGSAEHDRRQRAGDRARLANLELRNEMRDRGNYFPEIEAAAAEVLTAVGYPGHGPINERQLTDIAAYYGFRIERVPGMPRTARSITDQRSRVIYIPRREDLTIRAARSVILHTLGHFALDHEDTRDFGDYLRQRIESNYFAAAVLLPEAPSVALLQQEKERRDLSVEDLKEQFYVSYEMAAHRFTNLATRHLGLRVHFLRTDPDGLITKAYENDGIPFPADVDGGHEGERVSRQWGARQAWNTSDSFLLHYQFTVTDNGDYWCVTYTETSNTRTPFAVTLGSTAEDAVWFRGGDTMRRLDARQASNTVDPELIARWQGVAWPSAAERSHVLSALPAGGRPFSPFPGVDLIDVYRFLDRVTGAR
jgi:XRE family transcriptional regulator, fatty acid utilization regulator